MIKTFENNSPLNKGKLEQIEDVLIEYRKTAQTIANTQWRNFHETSRFDKNLKTPIESEASQRYIQTCRYQVVGILDSYLSNIQNEFGRIVSRSKLTNGQKTILNFINRRRLWKAKEHKEYLSEDLFLARKILNSILKRWKKPSFKNIQMNLDQKVAVITEKKPEGATEFQYWVRIATLNKGNPIDIPVPYNKYFENFEGSRKNFCQINIKENKLSIGLIKALDNYNDLDIDGKRAIYIPEVEKIGLDFGLVTMFTDNSGGHFGRGFMKILRESDKKLLKILRKNQRSTGKNRSPAYDKEVERLQNYMKNEWNRVINQIVKVHKPAEIVIEAIDFRNQSLSKQINRMLSKYGRRYVKAKLERLTELYGIIVTYVNPAYSSQECSNCGYIDEKNRKKQKEFLCLFCGLKLHADVNAARTLIARSSCLTANVHLSKKSVLSTRLSKFSAERILTREGTCRINSTAEILAKNPYFLVFG